MTRDLAIEMLHLDGPGVSRLIGNSLLSSDDLFADTGAQSQLCDTISLE